MNIDPNFETPAYRSVIRLLNLYCLFKMGIFLWNVVPFFIRILEDTGVTPGEFLIRFHSLLITPALVLGLLFLSLSRTKGAHIVRLIFLSCWLFLRLVFFPNIIGNPNIEHSIIVLNLLDLLCLGLFFYLLARRRKTPLAQHDA